MWNTTWWSNSKFKSRWELHGEVKGLGELQLVGRAENNAFWTIIIDKEISKTVEEMSNCSAPGPDGITLRDLNKMDPKYFQTMEILDLWLAIRNGTGHDEGILDWFNTKISQNRMRKGHQLLMTYPHRLNHLETIFQSNNKAEKAA